MVSMSAYVLVIRNGRCSIVPLQIASMVYSPSARNMSGGITLYKPYMKPRKAVNFSTGSFISLW